MKKINTGSLAAIAALTALGCCLEANGQLRGTFGPSSPGAAGRGYRADNSNLSAFQNYSYGLSSRSGGGPDSGILSAPGSSAFSINSAGLGGGPSNSGVLAPTAPRGMSYGGGSDLPALDFSGGSVMGNISGQSLYRTPSMFADNFGSIIPGTKDLASEPIKSLVPTRPGMYHDYLADGEKAFREGSFAAAYARFQMANCIGFTDPESLLSMSHAQFAINCYPMAAYHLRQVLKVLPQLAQLRLQPRLFYGDSSIYVENIIRLEEAIKSHPDDTDAQLLLAYYTWFNQDNRDGAEKTKLALSRAMAASTSPGVIEAIETFYAGMAATGKVSGRLFAAKDVTPPAQTTTGAGPMPMPMPIKDTPIPPATNGTGLTKQ